MLKPGGRAVELVSKGMREQLNSNPILQLAVIGVLLLGGVFFFMSMGGGGEEEESAVTATVSGEAGSAPDAAVEGAVESLEAGAAAGAAVPVPLGSLPGSAPPAPIVKSWKAGDTVVLLFVRDGGIDDRLVASATVGVAGLPRARVFVVPAGKISRYAAITEGVGVERVPALVVLTPKRLERAAPTVSASVLYGYQTPASTAQAVIDAGYRGPMIDYHP